MDQIVQTFVDGITYSGSLKHTLINHALLLIAILPHLVGRTQMMMKNNSNWIYALFSGTVVQILIWFSLNVVGISLIWSALTGFNLIFFYVNNNSPLSLKKAIFVSSFAIVFIAIIYYFIISPIITTVAHFLAILMGSGFYFLFRKQ